MGLKCYNFGVDILNWYQIRLLDKRSLFGSREDVTWSLPERWNLPDPTCVCSSFRVHSKSFRNTYSYLFTYHQLSWTVNFCAGFRSHCSLDFQHLPRCTFFDRINNDALFLILALSDHEVCVWFVNSWYCYPRWLLLLTFFIAIFSSLLLYATPTGPLCAHLPDPDLPTQIIKSWSLKLILETPWPCPVA